MNLFEDTYRTVESPSEGIFKDRGSKFLAYVFPLEDADYFKQHVRMLKELHPKANHYCWAYRLTTDRSVYRLNDDGEPAGTAGRPILNTLLSADLTNVLTVVVRYFGGTLLGVPGLINAYKSAAQTGIENAKVIEQQIHDVYALSFEYLQMNDVMRIIKQHDVQVLHQEFALTCDLSVTIRQMDVNKILKQFSLIEGLQFMYLRTH